MTGKRAGDLSDRQRARWHCSRELPSRRHGLPVLCLLICVLPLSPAFGSTLEVQTDHPNAGGFYGARLTLSKVCLDGDHTVPNGPLADDPEPIPCEVLKAFDVDVTSGTVRFQAGHSIELGDGFSVASGAIFIADPNDIVRGVAYLRDETPENETEYYARFFVDPQGLTLSGASDSFEHLVAYDAEGNREFSVGLTHNLDLGEHRLFATAYDDSGVAYTTRGRCELALQTGWQAVEVHWKASGGPEGDLRVRVDGGSFQSLQVCVSIPSVGNASGAIAAIEWGARNLSGMDFGYLDLDDFEAHSQVP